jgi:hypothetical protein
VVFLHEFGHEAAKSAGARELFDVGRCSWGYPQPACLAFSIGVGFRALAACPILIVLFAGLPVIGIVVLFSG